MAVSIGRVGKFKRYESAVLGTVPPGAFIEHLVGKCLIYERRKEFMQDAPLIVPPQLSGCFLEYAIVGDLPLPCLINEAVVKLEHREMHLCDQQVRVVARVTDHRNAFGVSLQVGAVDSEHELRWVVALVEEGMADRSIAVQTFEIKLRATRVQQCCRVSLRPQRRTIRRDVMRHELAEYGPPRSCFAERFREVVGVPAIA